MTEIHCPSQDSLNRVSEGNWRTMEQHNEANLTGKNWEQLEKQKEASNK